MYENYWGMSMNPFTKELPAKDSFLSQDFTQITERLNFLKGIRGIGVITGIPGSGKTRAVRSFTEELNPNLYRIIYTAVTNVSEAEFFRGLSAEMGLQPEFRKGANIIKINERIRKLYREQKITPVIIIDEAHCIRKPDFFLSMQAMMNFEMDSQDYAVLILAGQPKLNETLGLGVNEAFAERVRVNYVAQGITKEEVVEYVKSRLLLAKASSELFEPSALDALFGCCQGSVRKLNALIETALLAGYNQKAKTITTDIVMQAANEVAVV